MSKGFSTKMYFKLLGSLFFVGLLLEIQAKPPGKPRQHRPRPRGNQTFESRSQESCGKLKLLYIIVFQMFKKMFCCVSASLPDFMKESLISRIVGGQETEIPIPWQVSIRGHNHFCGGTILDSTTILSAAHCFNDGVIDGVTIMVGDVIVHGEQVIGIKELIFNPDKPYNEDTMDYDIVILKLQYEIPFEEGFVQPACLPDADFNPSAGSKCFVSGWGDIEYDSESPMPDILNWVRVQVIDQDKCIEMYQSSGPINDNMICANDEGKDSCQGDSGGPLICMDGEVPVITGAVSFGEGCADPNFPGVYARVAPHLDWIKAILQQPDDDEIEGTDGSNHGQHECPYPEWISDDYCDDETNIPACHYDGGDCCNPNASHVYCDKCDCKETQ